MDVVKAFNTELSSLYDVKPPISKAKMTSITKGAIKGIKFYKHIVQSVEKFIQKCRPEYKVPGLYVVDSIIRQSRHQFGADKDVFGPRFLKNISLTFQQLFKCAEDDRPKIIRVLNLWQKNAVFPIDVIQPLMDMGHPNTSNDWPLDAPAESVKETPVKSASANEEGRSSRRKEIDPALWQGWPQANDEPVSDKGTYAEMSTKNLEKFTKAEMTNAIENEVSSSSMFRTKIKQENLPEQNTVKFNKKLLDFDYGDEEDEEEVKNDDSHISNQPNALALSMAQKLLSNPELLHQLQQMQQTIQQSEQAFNSEMRFNQQSVKQEPEDVHYPVEARNSPVQQPPMIPTSLPVYSPASLPPNQADKDDRVIPEAVAPPRDLDERSLAAILAPLNRAVLPPMPYTEASMMPFHSGIPYPQQPPLPMLDPMSMDAAYPPALPPDGHLMQGSGHTDEDERVMYSMPGEPPLPPQDFDERGLRMPIEDGRSRKERSRSRSGSRTRGRGGRHRSRSRSPRRKRSRSRSPSRKNNRSRSKERERVREKERKREKEQDRKRKGLPPIKKNCVSVCTTTLWMGHVPKSCTEMEINSAFSSYGTILSIYMIPPRGCAYVVMDRRQDAYKALHKLKNTKILQSNSVKMAWAPGKGVKGKEYKDYWEVEAGVSYVPYEKIPEDPAALDLLEEGGFIDEESLPDNLRALRQQPEETPPFSSANKMTEQPAAFNAMQGPPMVPPPIIPPTSVNLPMLLHHPMQPQFGLHLPGLLPQAMMMQVPMGIPPPNPMLMVQQQSQNLLGSQALPMVGGVSPLVPRTAPPIASALQNLKNAQIADPAVGSPMVPPASATGDATPTDEDGTSVSSPNSSQKPVTNSVSIASTQPGIPSSQFNHPMMGLHNASRPMLPVPPPVSSSGTPIPYPPPHVSYNFPPPGMRQHGGMQPNSQFPWMQKSGSPFTEAESSQRTPGMPPHMFNRPPHPSNQSPMKDSNSTDRRSVDMDISGNRSTSPVHPDKMPQEMVISTDDESSMDRDYQHSEVPAGARFPGATEFPRMPMGMHRMRAPIPGVRFPQNMPMGAPFPARMGGIRPMGGPGMHPGHRMEDFPGPRGPRMPVAPPPPGPHRGESSHVPSEGREWYPRDFEAPPFERDRQFRDERSRESWTPAENPESDARRNNDGDRREEQSRDFEVREHQGANAYVPRGRPPQEDDDDFNVVQKPRPVRKSKPEKELMNDLFKLKFYQRNKNPGLQTKLKKQLEKKKTLDDKPSDKSVQKSENKDSVLPQTGTNVQVSPNSKAANEKRLHNETQDSINASREREARKRSRWGRTLSEEREFQEQRKCEIDMKRTEIEMKFQSYEQSAQAAQLLPNSDPSGDNSDSVSEIVKLNADNSENEYDIQNSSNESCLESIAQHADSQLVPNLPETELVPVPADTESFSEPAVPEISGELVSESMSVSEPTVKEDISVPAPVAELTTKSEIADFVTEPIPTNSLPQPNNHLNSGTTEVVSESVTKMTCDPDFMGVLSNPILMTTGCGNNSSLFEETSKDGDLSSDANATNNTTEACSTNMSVR